MKWSVSHSEYMKLNNAIGNALFNSLKDSSKLEPQLIANLVWHLPSQINSVTFSKGFSVKSGGIFVHTQPFVKCNNFPNPTPKSVEIGDLLLLRTGLQGGKVVDRRALLLQAKIIGRLPATPHNQNQHHFYAQWPSFKYERSTKALNGKARHVTGPDLYNAAKYLLIGKYPLCCSNSPFCLCCHHPLCRHVHNRCVLTAQPSQPDLSHYRCFFREIVEFILGDAGKSYVSPPPKRARNWDRVIQDLTTITAEQFTDYMKKSSSNASGTRGQTLAFLAGNLSTMTMAVLSNIGTSSDIRNGTMDGPPRVSDDWQRNKDVEGGISIIEFLVDNSDIRIKDKEDGSPPINED